MPEIDYTKLKAHLKDADSPASIYLIYGEEYFYKTVFEELVSAIIPEEKKTFNFETLDGTEDNIFEALERLNTFSFDTSAKVVGFCDADIFYSRQDNDKLVRKIKTDLADDNMRKAASNFQKLLSVMDIDPHNITETDRTAIIQADPDSSGNSADWLDKLVDYCRTDELPSTSVPNGIESLCKAVEKGFAPNNHLIITSDQVDKRLKLYKAIKDHGVIVDCSVASGSNQAAKKDQAEALLKVRQAFEAESGKKIEGKAWQALQEMIGFDLRTFSSSLKKLGDYIGARQTITAADVKTVLKRTKIDPIYEFTNAISERNAARALFFIQSLMDGAEPAHPLQILAAVINKMRGLLIIRNFMNSSHGASWRRGMRFDEFKRTTFPAIERYDADIICAVEARDAIMNEPASGKKKKKSRPTDIVIGAESRNLYPTYKNFEKAANFSEEELILAFDRLKTADLRLKGGSQSPRLVIEELIIGICAKGGRR